MNWTLFGAIYGTELLLLAFYVGTRMWLGAGSNTAKKGGGR